MTTMPRYRYQCPPCHVASDPVTKLEAETIQDRHRHKRHDDLIPAGDGIEPVTYDQPRSWRIPVIGGAALLAVIALDRIAAFLT